jgi:predicted site-specific integrase-resolvase
MFSQSDPKLKLLDPKDAAEFLGVKEQTLAVWRSARRYDLPYIKCGRLIKYREQALLDFLESRTVRPMAGVSAAAAARP